VDNKVPLDHPMAGCPLNVTMPVIANIQPQVQKEEGHGLVVIFLGLGNETPLACTLLSM
jgi:hypothetical protein